VLVFIDEKNVYRDARTAFFENYDTSPHGQFHPGMLGTLLVSLTQAPAAELVGVRVYTGRPDGSLDPKTYGAHMRQCSVWEKDPIVTLKWRPLRYPWGGGHPEQKGVDVQLAVDMVRLYIQGAFDVAILASTDTDLLPGVEALYELDRGLGCAPVEVAAWTSANMHKRLHVSGHPLWCHTLDAKQYQKVADLRDYNIAS
jgi:uncharacterized LabA/DUF88 family protein